MTDQPTAERYVAGTLSDEEVARFEESMIERPELAADVNVRRRIKAGLSVLEERKELDSLLTPPVQRTQNLRYATAATVVALAVGLWSTWRMERATPVPAMFASADAGASRTGTSFMLVRTRSAEVPVFEVRRNAGLVRLQILVDASAGAPFSVRIGDDELSIPRTSDGFVEVYLDPQTLVSGKYTLSLKPQSGAEQHFPFTLNVSP